jgi:hypothetical protein
MTSALWGSNALGGSAEQGASDMDVLIDGDLKP